MRFENITFESHNSIHRYFIDGVCQFQSAADGYIKLIIELKEPIYLPTVINRIIVNNICFECIQVQMSLNSITAKITEIDSYLYTQKLDKACKALS